VISLKRRAILFLSLVIFCSLFHPRSFCAETNASAGWAEVEITPPLGIFLGGRGGPLTRAAKVLSPLFAQVTCLKDVNGNLFVLVSFDLVGMPHDLSDRIRTGIVHETGAGWNLVVLNTSHTHSGPYMIRSLMAGVGPPPENEVKYFADLEDKIIRATRKAFRNLRPVSVEVFAGTSDVAINRRGKNQKGQRGIIPDPAGAYDEKVWVLKLTPANGTPPAIVFSYACHPVLVYGYALAAISSDFPGVARSHLKGVLGEKLHAQFVQGFAGNVRPRVVADLEKKRFRGSKPADLQKAGKDLADAVLAAVRGPGTGLVLDLAGASDRPFLPRGEPPPRELYEKMREGAVATTNDYLVAASDYWLSRYDAHEGFAKGDVWSLGLIRLAGNQWILHSGGEPCVEWRGKISGWLAPLNLVTFGYSQEGKSYLPTEGMLPEGGYEVLESNRTRASTPAPYAVGIEEAIRESLVSQRAALLQRDALRKN
jgi:neutral ceramidase